MKTVINIGLNVGTKEPEGQLKKALKLIKPSRFIISSGIWQVVTERTIIAEIGAKKFKELQNICDQLQQDAISYKNSKISGLIWNSQKAPEYNFNPQLFNNF